MNTLELALEALEKLARLGNEPHYGNSKGNDIAIAALAALKEAIKNHGEPAGEVVNSGASWDQIVLVKFAGEVRPALGTKLYTTAPEYKGEE